MNYSYTQLARVSPRASPTSGVAGARRARLWKRYLRVVAAHRRSHRRHASSPPCYFVLLPPFAWAARRAERRETTGWTRDRARPPGVADEPVLT